MQKLKLVYQCESYAELARILGVSQQNIYIWKNHGIPANVKGLLQLIEEQQKELIKLKEKE